MKRCLYKIFVLLKIYYLNRKYKEAEKKLNKLMNQCDLGMVLPPPEEVEFTDMNLKQTIVENGQVKSTWEVPVNLTGREN